MIKNRLFLLFVASFLVACKSNDSLSIAQVDKVIVDFKHVTFVPPPRSIGDLKEILPQPQIPAYVQLAPRCNNQERDGEWINRFKTYLTRYKPNERINTSVDDVGNWKIEKGWEINRAIALLELRRGNLKNAIAAQKKFLQTIPDNKKGTNVQGYALLSISYTQIGDLNSAKQALSEAEQWDIRASRRKAKYILNHDSWLERAKGELSSAQGKLLKAEKHFRLSLQKKRQFKSYATDVAHIQSLLATNLAQQGRLIEAENEIRQAIQHSYINSGLSKLVNAPILYRLSEILLLQGRYQEAETVAASSVWIYQHGCMPSGSIEYAKARRSLAYALFIQEKFPQVLTIFRSIEEALGKQNPVYTTFFENDIVWSYALSKTNAHLKALKKQKNALQYSLKFFGKQHPKTAINLGFMALIELQAGNSQSAKSYFKQSTQLMLAATRQNEINSYYRKLIFEAWLNELAPLAKQGDEQAIAKMLQLTESLRSSSVQEAVAAMGVRAAVNNNELASLLRKEQNIKNKLKSLELTLINALSNGLPSSIELKEQVALLRKAYHSIEKKILEDFPEYADILQARPVDIKKIQASLNPDEALIVTYVSKKTSYIWSISSSNGIRFQSVALGQDDLKIKVNHLLQAMHPTGPSLDDIPEFDVQSAYQLYHQLLEPLKSSWAKAKHLLLVTHGPLGYLPFALLPTENKHLSAKLYPAFSNYRTIPWLIKKYSISVLPSANSVLTLQKIADLSHSTKTSFIGFGAPLFNKQQMIKSSQEQVIKQRGSSGMTYQARIKTRGLDSATIEQLPDLPETANELKEIARNLGNDPETSVFIGLKANEDTVKKIDLSNFRIIMFATHGLIPGDLNGLRQPALALSTPSLTGLPGDGLLTMDEIMNLNLSSDWVILSACNTGSSGSDSAEAVSGLGKAFFYAGAHALLVSNWSVESQSSKKLTTGIFNQYKNHPEHSRATTLQLSMLKLLNEGAYKDPKTKQIVFSYAHPIFWAPFSLVGDGR